MKTHVAFACVILTLCAGVVDAAVAHDESINGDLSDISTVPDFVETSPALRNDIIGTVGGSGDHSDTLYFYVPPGCRLVEVELVDYFAAGGNTTTYFGLHAGTGGTGGALITDDNLGEPDVGSGLLDLGGLASQTSGSYSIWIDEATAGQSYTLRIHLEVYRWDEETLGSDGLNGDWNDGSPVGFPWLPISVRGSQIRGTVGGSFATPGDNNTDGIWFHIPQGYELVDITLKEYVTTGGNLSTATWLTRPGDPIADAVFDYTASAVNIGANILGTQRIGPGDWTFFVSESNPGQTFTFYLRMAPEGWNEAIHGELPDLASAQNISFVGGNVEWSGVSDNSGNDRDAVRITVPAGWTLERLMLIDYVTSAGNTSSGFGVYDDASAIIEGLTMHEGYVGEDLLDVMGLFYLDSGTYRVRLNEVTAGQTYTFRAELGRVIWHEHFQGDLSNNQAMPTSINISSSTTGQLNDLVGYIGDQTADRDDFAVFTLTAPKVITEFTVLEYDPVGTNISTQFRIREGVGDSGPIVIDGDAVRPGMVGVNLISNERVGAILPPGTYTIHIKEAQTNGNPYVVRLTSDLSYVFADGFESGNTSAWD